ncbi:MAG: aminomethyl-transferring glycine dehydrogenase [Ilumatobacteraceae bacterium]
MTSAPHPLTRPGFDPEHFALRHLGLSDEDRRVMLETIGAQSLEELLDEAVPGVIRLRDSLRLDPPLPEHVVLDALRARFHDVVRRRSLIGQGYYGTRTPPVVLRNVLENPSWYTAYTPYQPEISQGRLEALLNFQTMVSELTALPLANASLLDEATAVAEAVTMARRLSRVASDVVVVDANTHPQTIAVLRTRCEPVGISVLTKPVGEIAGVDCFAAVVSWPGSDGALPDPSLVRHVTSALGDAGAFSIATTDLLACTLIVPPGELGFDVVVGSSQRFGVPLGFGGPHAAFISTRQEHARALPGRLVGVSNDTEGRPALRLALQTREQHIRREKATSNICTAQVLLANIAGMYGVWHGPDGLVEIARRVHSHAHTIATSFVRAGLPLAHAHFFDTVSVTDVDADAMVARARSAGFNIRKIDDRTVSLSVDELTTPEEVDAVLLSIGVDTISTHDLDSIDLTRRRTSTFMEQKVFSSHKSEHEMLRYLRSLADKDLALDRTMIPLGSCTMKLNSTTEMIPVTWDEFSGLHPFAPNDETRGMRRVVEELETMLCEITGYDAVSLQPNAGSQGEFAGLLAIRAYHRSRGDDQRTVCLIPDSAHGTNAASAVMAGMRVVVVRCDDNGNVDYEDLAQKAEAAGDTLAALMVTYPSTHGVFEEAISDICDVVHRHGGQVYVDGANLNALVGTARPGRFGADVSHLNLHKTFCIPHGGGGPGVGPVAVRSHLAPFLPGDPLGIDQPVGPVSAARYGSAGILGIPWVYIAMMGAHGLLQATADAILAANYVAARLDDDFPVLYRGANGRVAHECILNVGAVLKGSGLTVDDIAKRLMDHVIHAPTMSFPVANTLMVEPTESESLTEIDRFCDAMKSIRAEIADVLENRTTAEESPLRHAPHTVEDIAGDWSRPYSRDKALFPVPGLRRRSYFAPVSRIDAAHGDRNLVCTCAPIEAYAESLDTVGS